MVLLSINSAGYGLGIDPYYILLVLPAMLLSLWAQYKVKTAFSEYSKKMTSRNITGYDVARGILDGYDLKEIAVERVGGNLTDHYDPGKKVIRLSDSVYGSNSVAAAGVAAHEAGHAVQYAAGYYPIRIRTALVPITNIGSTLSMPLILIGYLSGIPPFVYIGIALFSIVTLFQLVTLPVEYNAGKRALGALSESGIMQDEELDGAKKVLSAAALTYVASLIVSFMSLLRILLVFNRRENKR